MAKIKGESSFDSNTRTVRKFVNVPLPVKEYEGKLLPGATIEKAPGQGKLPYIKVKIEALNSASQKGGKNRTLQSMFFLNTTPNAKGNSHIESGDQLVAYCKSINTRLKCSCIPDTKIGDDGAEQAVMILDPNKALKFIEGTAGTVFRFKSKNEPSMQDKTVLWPKVDHFIEADAEGAEETEDEDEEADADDEDETDDEDEADESEEDGDEDDDSDEDDEDEDEEVDEDEDAPKKASKVKQGPLTKGKTAKKK